MLSKRTLENLITDLIIETEKPTNTAKINELEDIIAKNIKEATQISNFFLLPSQNIYNITKKSNTEEKEVYLKVIKHIIEEKNDSERISFIKAEKKERAQREKEKMKIEAARKRREEKLESLIKSNKIEDNNISIGVYGCGTGKTSLISRYIEDKFDCDTESTMEDSYHTDYDFCGKKFAVTFLDTPSCWNYITLTKKAMKDADSAIMMVAYNEKYTLGYAFDHLKLMSEVKKKQIPMILCINKCDKNRVVTEEELSPLKDEMKCPVFYTSCKDGTNVNEAVKTIIEETIFNKYVDNLITK